MKTWILVFAVVAVSRCEAQRTATSWIEDAVKTLRQDGLIPKSAILNKPVTRFELAYLTFNTMSEIQSRLEKLNIRSSQTGDSQREFETILLVYRDVKAQVTKLKKDFFLVQDLILETERELTQIGIDYEFLLARLPDIDRRLRRLEGKSKL